MMNIKLNPEVMTNEKDVIMKLVRDYATALNAAQIEAIPTFYTDDALFLPDGQKSFTKSELQEKVSDKFFSENKFSIEYSPENVVVNAPFAFVMATAKTTTNSISLGTTLNQTSRDFFVFKKVAENWKIFRYMFNSENATN